MRKYLSFVMLLSASCLGQVPVPLGVAEIMSRVAANQDQAEKLRSQYVYHQRIHVVTHKPHGRLLREETTEYKVVPGPNETTKELQLLTGRYWHKGKYAEYQGEPAPEPDSIDGSLIHSFRDGLNNTRDKDGLAQDLFPLTTKEQESHEFRLVGEEVLHDRPVYKIEFRPKDASDITWAGEALIDKAEFQPVVVSTKLSKRLPLFVRAALGTDVPGLGFNVQYRRQPDGVWFPVTFGTEFRLRALFFINRDISMSLENTQFEHTHVDSKIKFDGTEANHP